MSDDGSSKEVPETQLGPPERPLIGRKGSRTYYHTFGPVISCQLNERRDSEEVRKAGICSGEDKEKCLPAEGRSVSIMELRSCSRFQYEKTEEELRTEFTKGIRLFRGTHNILKRNWNYGTLELRSIRNVKL